MNTARQVTFTVAVFALVLAEAKAADWKAYKFEEYNCQLAFPGKPEAEGQGFVFTTGSVKCSFWSVELPADVKTSRTQRFEANRDNVVDDFDGKLFLDTPVKWKGHYGRHFAFTFKEKGLVWANDTKVIEAGSTAYSLTVITLLGQDTEEGRALREAEVVRFFDSFDLLKPVKSTARPEAQTFDGVWVVVAEEGEAAFPGKMTGMKLVCHEGDFVWRCPNKEDKRDGLFRGKLERKETAGSGEIDLGYDILKKATPGKDQTVRGIWKVVGDTLTWTQGEPGGPRPRGFSTKAGGGKILLTLKRPGDENRAK